MNSGWVSVHRKIMECWVWEKPLYLKAWLAIILSANHREVKIPFDGKIITIQKGQFITSRRKLMEQWGCSINTVKEILDVFESDGMIERKSDHRMTLITVNNYEKYQQTVSPTVSENDYPIDTVSDTPTDTVNDTVSDTIGDNKQYSINTDMDNDNNDNNVNTLITKNSSEEENTLGKPKVQKKPVSFDLEELLSEYSWTDELKEAVRSWIDFKREQHRFTYKPTSLKTLLKQIDRSMLEHCSPLVENAIENAIANGYQGIGLDRIKNKPVNNVANQQYEFRRQLQDL